MQTAMSIKITLKQLYSMYICSMCQCRTGLFICTLHLTKIQSIVIDRLFILIFGYPGSIFMHVNLGNELQSQSVDYTGQLIQFLLNTAGLCCTLENTCEQAVAPIQYPH